MINNATPLTLVGAGKMGTALLDAWLDRGMDAAGVTIIDPGLPENIAEGYRNQGLQFSDQPAGSTRLIVLSVKPQIMGEVLAAIGGNVPGDAIVVSVAAGITMETLSATFSPEQAIIRVMPNTPALAGEGMSVLCANEHADTENRQLIETLMDAVGKVAWITDETLMDAVTAVSGSGPAYVFLLAECLTEAAVTAGLPPDLAAELARQTVIGGGALLAQSDLAASTLRKNVTSPGGTTQAALEILMDADAGFGPLLERAVLAAKARSVMLG